MPTISSALQNIPEQFKPLAAFGIGAGILVVLVLFHGIGLHGILVHFKRRELRLQTGRPHQWVAMFLFGWAIFLMLWLHIIEIVIWAFTLRGLGLILSAKDALYFCANAYTTLGYGTVDLGPYWRLISPIIAISGLFTFAWTTSSLVGIVSIYMKLVEQLEIERAQELKMRSDTRRAEWDVFVHEQQTEDADRADTRKRAAAAGSFLQRREVWRDETQREEQLRAAALADARRLRDQEHAAENDLGHSQDPDHPPEASK